MSLFRKLKKDSNPKEPNSKEPTDNASGNVYMYERRDKERAEEPTVEWWRRELTEALAKASKLEDMPSERGLPRFRAQVRAARAQLWLMWKTPPYAVSEKEFNCANELYESLPVEEKAEKPRTDQADIAKMRDDGLKVVGILMKLKLVDGLTEEHIKDLGQAPA